MDSELAQDLADIARCPRCRGVMRCERDCTLFDDLKDECDEVHSVGMIRRIEIARASLRMMLCMPDLWPEDNKWRLDTPK